MKSVKLYIGLLCALLLSGCATTQPHSSDWWAESIAASYTQYAVAYVAFEAEKTASTDSRKAESLRKRAAGLFLRARETALNGLEEQQPGFLTRLMSDSPQQWPDIQRSQVELAYWASAAWGGYIAMSKDVPEVVADLPVAQRLAKLAYQSDPEFGQGALASLMGIFEASRPGGSLDLAGRYFDQAIQLGAGVQSGPYVDVAEYIALPRQDQALFEQQLQLAVAIAEKNPSRKNQYAKERAEWLLSTIDELF